MDDVISSLSARLAPRGFTGLEPVGRGLEFSVFRGRRSADGAAVAVRVGERRFDSNVNDPFVDTRALLVQEYELTRFLGEHGVPVAEPVDLVLSASPAEPDVLVSQYLPDDGSTLDWFALGGILARLHSLAPPPVDLVAGENLPVARLIVERLLRRWAEIGRMVASWPRPPAADALALVAARLGDGSLVHLDVRRENVRCQQGALAGLLDWSNALRADAALEFGRLAEFARLPDNHIELGALRAGYQAESELPRRG